MNPVPGHVKLQSIALPFGKHLIPQFLFVDDRVWRPCSLPISTVTDLGDGQKIVRIAFESEMNAPCWISIDTSVHNVVEFFDDRSALFECEIEVFENLRPELSCEHRNFFLRVFHHTKCDVVPLIFNSKTLWGSKWNYEGAVELADTHFVYFTDVTEFNSPEDFRRVAMTDGGFKIGLEYDDPSMGVEILEVPERDRCVMDAKIEAFIHPSLIETQPMLYHDPTIRGESVARYWELFHRNIFRIPVKPGGSIQVIEQGQEITIDKVNDFKSLDRILAGCAFVNGQLRVVFDETDGAGMPIGIDANSDPDPVRRFLQ